MDSNETDDPSNASPDEAALKFAASALGGAASIAVGVANRDDSLPAQYGRAVFTGILAAAVDDALSALSDDEIKKGVDYGQMIYFATKLGVNLDSDGMHKIVMAGFDALCRKQDRISTEVNALVDAAQSAPSDPDDEDDDEPDDFRLMLERGPAQAAAGAAAFFAAVVAGFRLFDSIIYMTEGEELQRAGWSAEIDARLSFARDSLVKAASAAIYERETWDDIRQERGI
jgi:hypothetical protein